jgi:hypothetical protein
MSNIIGLGALNKKYYEALQIIKEYTEQQRSLYTTGTLAGGTRILSISRPHIHAIARSKARGMYEFGAKISVSLYKEWPMCKNCHGIITTKE